MGSLEDKVRKARRAATNSSAVKTAYKTVNRNAKTAGVKLSRAEEIAAMKVIGPRIKLDRQRTASRAVGIQKMQEKKAATKRAAAAIGNTVSKVKATVKPKTTSTPKITSAAKPAPSSTAASQLKNTTRIKDANGNMVVTSGVFGNKFYDIKNGKPVLNKKETDYWFNSNKNK